MQQQQQDVILAEALEENVILVAKQVSGVDTNLYAEEVEQSEEDKQKLFADVICKSYSREGSGDIDFFLMEKYGVINNSQILPLQQYYENFKDDTNWKTGNPEDKCDYVYTSPTRTLFDVKIIQILVYFRFKRHLDVKKNRVGCLGYGRHSCRDFLHHNQRGLIYYCCCRPQLYIKFLNNF